MRVLRPFDPRRTCYLPFSQNPITTVHLYPLKEEFQQNPNTEQEGNNQKKQKFALFGIAKKLEIRRLVLVRYWGR